VFENGANEMVRVLIYREFGNAEKLARSEANIISLRPIHKLLNRQPISAQKHISEKTNPNQTAELSGYSFQQPYI
jgi:hypothetical protein